MTARGDRRDGDDVREYGRVLWRRRGLILAVAAIVVAVVLLLTLLESKTYTASSTVLVKPIPASGSTTTAPLQQPNMETEQALVTQSRQIAERVRGAYPELTVPELDRNVSAQIVPNTELLVITYRDSSPTRAAQLARAFARAYVQFRVGVTAGQMAASEAPIEARISDLQATVNRLRKHAAQASGQTAVGDRTRIAAILTQLASLRQQLLDVKSNVEMAQNSATIVSAAPVPGAPSSPDVKRNVLMAIAAGLLLGVGLALIFDRLDDRVRDPQTLGDRLGLPVLTTIPAGRKPAEGRPPLELVSDPDSDASESYRVLADTVVALATGDRVRTVAVTSAVDGVGRSSASSNLAVALAELGRPVALVSTDHRSPSIYEFFGVHNGGRAARGRLPATAMSEVVADPGIPNLRVVSAGSNGDGGRRVQGEELARVCASLQREGAEFVVLDAPPVLETADSTVVARAADGVIIVVDDDTPLPTLERAVARLRQQHVRIIGAVLRERAPVRSDHRNGGRARVTKASATD